MGLHTSFQACGSSRRAQRHCCSAIYLGLRLHAMHEPSFLVHVLFVSATRALSIAWAWGIITHKRNICTGDWFIYELEFIEAFCQATLSCICMYGYATMTRWDLHMASHTRSACTLAQVYMSILPFKDWVASSWVPFRGFSDIPPVSLFLLLTTASCNSSSCLCIVVSFPALMMALVWAT